MGGNMAQPPLDPLGMWRDMLNQWEQGLNKLSTETMQTTESARMMNQAMTMSLKVQQGMTEMMARYLHALGLPTRSDLLSIGERLKAMEDQLQALSIATDKPPAPPSTESRPPRTKKPASETAP
jgi:Poly(R)-hydroxyalkanoic acid synthase subunit (PHA_synth_III_E)